MSAKILLTGLCLMVCSYLLPAVASEFKDEGRLTNVNVQIGKVTEIVFPSKIAKVVKGGDPESVLVEVLDNSLYVLPKTESPPDIFVTTVLGSSYPLNLHLAKEHDIKIQVAPSRPNQASSGQYLDVMDLMKDLLLDKEPAGATLLSQGGESILTNSQIQIKVSKAYELLNWKAYVLTAYNLSPNAVIVPIEQLSLPHLLAVSAEQEMLKAKGQEGDTTKLYMIVEN